MLAAMVRLGSWGLGRSQRTARTASVPDPKRLSKSPYLSSSFSGSWSRLLGRPCLVLRLCYHLAVGLSLQQIPVRGKIGQLRPYIAHTAEAKLARSSAAMPDQKAARKP
jgi:hypothetical protein